MTTREKVMEALAAEDKYISGEALAKMLGISRNSIWKAVKQLQNEGVDIDAISNKGYKLKDSSNILSEALIKKFLNKENDRKVYVLKEVDSTNNYAKELARSGAEDGTAVIAEMQSAGKGRMGRSFCSPSGVSVYMSVIVRPKCGLETSQLITSCAAVAAAEAIDSVCGTDTKIKWVNDLYLNRKKICGILTEAALSVESGQIDYAVIGIGINVLSVKDIFTDEIKQVATSIEDETGVKNNRCQIAAEIIKRLELHIKKISDKNFLQEYRRRSIITGCRVSVIKNNGEREAEAVGISDTAGLIVRYDDNTEEELNSGEARIIKNSIK